ncbi:MAG: hypothetical protein WC061_06075, partial [Melioribacteraceae bacterium]
MKRLFYGVVLFLMIFGSLSQNSVSAQDDQTKGEKKFTGLWEGKLKISTVSLRLVIKTFNNDDGSLGAFVDSPDQGSNNIPVTLITINDDSLKFSIQAIGASYAGGIIKDSALVRGTFKQGGLVLPLEFKKIEKLTEIKRPQEPKKPYPYNEEEVTFE